MFTVILILVDETLQLFCWWFLKVIREAEFTKKQVTEVILSKAASNHLPLAIR